jgi:hypothetical protein
MLSEKEHAEDWDGREVIPYVCNIRVYFACVDSEKWCDVWTVHRDINNGMSTPNISKWMTTPIFEDVVAQTKAETKNITLEDSSSRVQKTFTIYYTFDIFQQNMPIKLRLHKVWYGELAVFRRAARGNRMINFRSDPDGMIAWNVIKT